LLDVAELRDASRRISRANELNPDPNTSSVVATAATLGLAAVARCGVGQPVFVDMFGANAYANFDDFFDHPGKPARASLDAAGLGVAPHRRLYRAADGWVLLAVEAPRWNACRTAIAALANGNRDEATAFASRDADWWADRLLARGFTGVRADGPTPPERIAGGDLTIDATAQAWGVYRRHAPLLRFSESGTDAVGGWPALGEHTNALLREIEGPR